MNAELSPEMQKLNRMRQVWAQIDLWTDVIAMIKGHRPDWVVDDLAMAQARLDELQSVLSSMEKAA